jgi:hypothetical protein
MPILSRRRAANPHQVTWHVYSGDVHVGAIGERAGVPIDVDQVLECLVTFLILWVALMPDRLGYGEGGEGGASRRSKPAGTPPATPAKAGGVDSTAISAIRNVPCVTHLIISLVI